MALQLERAYFEKRNVSTILHQPWQLGLFPAYFDGKFVWYPEKGTLMCEDKTGTHNVGTFHSKEEVYEQIKKRMHEQLPEDW